jgi:predicted mannosyl-3-phosphoglycerate phosphatase (HAD superfamily)
MGVPEQDLRADQPRVRHPLPQSWLQPRTASLMDIAVDFDGTLVDQQLQWLPGALEALQRMVKAGHKVIIHSCRANWPEGMASIEHKLQAAGLGIPIWDQPGKPAADIYVDDRAVHFANNWAEIIVQLERAAGLTHMAPTIRTRKPSQRRRPPVSGWH